MRQPACCTWCNSIVEAPAHYNPLQHDLYCCRHCREKDWLFRKWMNDKYLNWIAKEYQNGKSKDGGVPEM